MGNAGIQNPGWRWGMGEDVNQNRLAALSFCHARALVIMTQTFSPSMTSGRGHYDLDAWKVSRQLVGAIYRLTQGFPREEMFGLTSQMRRASVSIPSNIAEGAARAGSREYAQFLNLARGSLSELETQLFIAADLGYIKSDHPVFTMVDRVSKLVTGLHKAIRNR
jgi:four helix bundle protein